MLHRYEGPLDVPRRCMRQTYRANISINNPEDYWRVVVLNLMSTSPMLKRSLEAGFLRWHNMLFRFPAVAKNVSQYECDNGCQNPCEQPNISGLTKELGRGGLQQSSTNHSSCHSCRDMQLTLLQPLRTSISLQFFNCRWCCQWPQRQSSVQTHLSNSSKVAFVAQRLKLSWTLYCDCSLTATELWITMPSLMPMTRLIHIDSGP